MCGLDTVSSCKIGENIKRGTKGDYNDVDDFELLNIEIEAGALKIEQLNIEIWLVAMKKENGTEWACGCECEYCTSG